MLSLAEVPPAAGPVPLVCGAEVLVVGGPLVVGAGIAVWDTMVRIEVSVNRVSKSSSTDLDHRRARLESTYLARGCSGCNRFRWCGLATTWPKAHHKVCTMCLWMLIRRTVLGESYNDLASESFHTEKSGRTEVEQINFF